MAWTITFLDDRVEAELEVQPDDIRASFERIAHVVTNAGLDRLPAKYARHLQGKLWELRMTGRDGIARALYVTASGERVVVLRVFTKKSEKTPRSEIELALKRAQEIE